MGFGVSAQRSAQAFPSPESRANPVDGSLPTVKRVPNPSDNALGALPGSVQEKPAAHMHQVWPQSASAALVTLESDPLPDEPGEDSEVTTSNDELPLIPPEDADADPFAASVQPSESLVGAGRTRPTSRLKSIRARPSARRYLYRQTINRASRQASE